MSAASIRGLSESEEDRAFMQRRVSMFALAIGGVVLGFWLYRVAAASVLGEPVLGDPSLSWHLAAALCFIAPWILMRKKPRSAEFVSLGEMGALCSGVLAISIAAFYLPPENRPDFVLLLALTNLILGRATFVPCTGQGTLVFVVIFGTILLVTVYMGTLRIDHEQWSTLYPQLSSLEPRRAALYATLEIGVWWSITAVLATAIASVIYGLRWRARNAEELGQYKLEEKLGEGGMGVVYRASHAFLRRPTAVKLLPPEKAGADNVRRFEQEVQLTASLTHPNTITIFDYGHTADGLFYYAMEYIHGLDLAGLVARSGPQHEGRVVDLMLQAASALVEAHGIGLVHRDIKPSNIMVRLLHQQGDAGDCVKLLDFGLVKQTRNEGGIELTDEANLSGTPQYMAPESIKNPSSVDARVDIYALGAVAYYLLTGTHVFGGATIVEVCSHHLHSRPEPPSSRRGQPIDPDLEALVLECLAKDAADRPQSALELKRRLQACRIAGWGPEQAQAWWAAHGDTPRPVVESDDSRPMTVEVRVDSRMA
ncbi:MAG: serine/threonine-protein kinase [Myxococcota bacterium]